MKRCQRLLSLAFLVALATVALVCAGASAEPSGPFSIASILSHKEALDGAHDVELSGDLAFVPGKGGSLAVIDVADPQQPSILWFRHDAEFLRDAETVLPVDGHLLLGTCDFFSIDVSRPRQPVFLKRISNRENNRIDRINGMVKRGDYVVAANKAGWIDVFDVSALGAPRLFGALDVRREHDLRDPHDLDAWADYIVIAIPNGFGRNPTGKVAVFRVADAKGGRLVPVDRWRLTGVAVSERLIGANRIQVSGSFAYVAGSCAPSVRHKPGLAVVELSDPARPKVVACVPFSGTRGPNGLTVVEDVVFLAGGQTVEAVDVSDPVHPLKIASQKFPEAFPTADDNAHDLVYRDGYLYVSGQSDHRFVILKVNSKRVLDLARQFDSPR